MKILYSLAVLLTLFFTALPSISTASTESYCRGNYKALHRSLASCMKAEKQAKQWLATNPVADDIFASCRRGAGQSKALLKDCALKEGYKRNARSLSPFNLRNSEVWYAASLSEHFPSLLRACGMGQPIDDFAVLPRDITKFNFSTNILTSEMLPLYAVKGRVKIAPIPLSVSIKKKKGRKSYYLYIDAFLISPDNRVIDIRSTEATAPLSSHGGTASFSFKIGKGYYFDKGGTILVVASGEPITSDYPDASCLLLGAKKITFGK